MLTTPVLTAGYTLVGPVESSGPRGPKGYVFDRIEASGPTIVLEVPFMVRNGREADEYKELAERDFGIIMNFVRKHGLEKKVSLENLRLIIDQAKIVLFNEGAFLRAYITHPDWNVLNTVCEIMFNECRANLPKKYADGGLTPDGLVNTEPKPKRKKREQGNLEFYSKIVRKLNLPPPLEEAVPAPGDLAWL